MTKHLHCLQVLFCFPVIRLKIKRLYIVKMLSSSYNPRSYEIEWHIEWNQADSQRSPPQNWDLLILLDKPEIEHKDYDNVAYPFVALSWDVGELISPILYTKDEWKQYSFTPFYKNVEQDGIVLAWKWMMKNVYLLKDETDRQSYQEHSFLVQTVQGKPIVRIRVCAKSLFPEKCRFYKAVDILWSIVINHLPKLKEEAQTLLEQ